MCHSISRVCIISRDYQSIVGIVHHLVVCLTSQCGAIDQSADPVNDAHDVTSYCVHQPIVGTTYTPSF